MFWAFGRMFSLACLFCRLDDSERTRVVVDSSVRGYKMYRTGVVVGPSEGFFPTRRFFFLLLSWLDLALSFVVRERREPGARHTNLRTLPGG